MAKKKKKIILESRSEVPFLEEGEEVLGFPCHTEIEFFGVNHSIMTEDEAKALLKLMSKIDEQTTT